MKRITDIIYRLAAFAVLFSVVSCSEKLNGEDRPDASGKYILETEALAYGSDKTDSGSGYMPESIHVCIFRNGVLSEVLPGIAGNGGKFYLRLSEKSGNMYVLADTDGIVDVESLAGTDLKESEWLDMTLPSDAGMYYTGMVNLDSQENGNYNLPVSLTRSKARFDLSIYSNDRITVDRVTFKGVMQDSYFLPKDPVSSPQDAVPGDLTVTFDEPVEHSKDAVAYIGEQKNPELTVEVNITADGRTYTKEARLPETISRNTRYSIIVKKNASASDITLEVLEWNHEDDDVKPDFASAIRVDLSDSQLSPDIEVSEDRRTVVLPYTDVDGIIALECNEELEYIPSSRNGLSVEPVMAEDGVTGTNRFRVRKEWWRIGVSGGKLDLQFKRKSLDLVYPDDRITLVLTENPVVMEGLLDFTAGYEYDFARYIDNELGRLTVPAEKTVTVEYEPGEDQWIKLDRSEDGSGTVRVLGGWRPNDVTADGRIQSARLVVANAADGSQREEYTIARRNWGLPVTYMNGIWWCKYNAMGNSKSFEDQILPSEDPAVKAGKTVFEYLQTCSPEEFFNLWKWEYQGDSGIGLEVKDIDGVAKLDGFRHDVKVHMNALPPTTLAPDGYEIPSFDDFGRVFGNTSGDYIWIMWDGSHISPWNGGTNVQRRNKRRNDVSVGSVQMQDLFFMAMYKNGDTENEPVVWYGAGAQWDDNGVKHGHYNNILFTVYSPEKKGWYFIGPMHAFYINQNGAGTKDSRIVRFKKSDVEYIY